MRRIAKGLILVIPPNEIMPLWAGLIFRDWQYDVKVCCALPFNLPLRFGYVLWCWVRHPWCTIGDAEAARRAYQQGRQKQKTIEENQRLRDEIGSVPASPRECPCGGEQCDGYGDAGYESNGPGGWVSIPCPSVASGTPKPLPDGSCRHGFNPCYVCGGVSPAPAELDWRDIGQTVACLGFGSPPPLPEMSAHDTPKAQRLVAELIQRHLARQAQSLAEAVPILEKFEGTMSLFSHAANDREAMAQLVNLLDEARATLARLRGNG